MLSRLVANTSIALTGCRPDTNAYLYNTRSELTNATAAVDALYRYGYDFDDIGNRKTSAERGANSVYAANPLNQYTAVADGLTTNHPTSQPSTSHPSTPQLLFYTHDGNKNVSEVISAAGETAAHYEYAPFGALTAQHGTSAAYNPWRFSSEYAEDDTAMVYYNYRHYEPLAGRWMQRDPIGESGGVNIMCYVANRVGGTFEYMGLSPSPHSVCVNAVANAMAGVEYQSAKKYLDKKAKSKKGRSKTKCEVKVFCECCNGWSRFREGGNYNDETGIIVICENKLNNADDKNEFAKTVLKHEMLHAIQNCDGPIEDSCDSSICREIHAYYNSHALKHDREDSKRIVVENGVLLSSEAFCSDCTRDDMLQKISDMYESCKTKWKTK